MMLGQFLKGEEPQLVSPKSGLKDEAFITHAYSFSLKHAPHMTRKGRRKEGAVPSPTRPV